MPISIIIHQRILAHYRLPIYDLLSHESSLQVTYIAGQARKDDPQIIPWEKLPSIKLNNVYLNIPILKKWICWQQGLIYLILSVSFDVLIMCSEPYNLTSWLLPIICKFRTKPTIVWTNFYDFSEKGFKFFIRKMQLNTHSALLLYSNSIGKYLVKHGFNQKNLFIVNNSLNFQCQLNMRTNISKESISNMRSSLTSGHNARLLIHLGRLIPDKKLDQLFLGIQKLVSRNHNVHLAIIGDGPLYDDLKNVCTQLRIQSLVHFCGALYDEKEIASRILASDLAVYPGNGGLPILHCLTYGIPVIVHDNQSHIQTPEVEAIINSETGDRYNENSIDDMISVIEHWLYGNINRQSIQAQCIKMIENFYTSDYQKSTILSAIKYVLKSE